MLQNTLRRLPRNNLRESSEMCKGKHIKAVEFLKHNVPLLKHVAKTRSRNPRDTL